MSLHIAIDNKAPVAKTVLMPGDPLRAKYIAEHYLDDVQMYSSIRNMYGFTGTYKGKQISIQGSGMGMPSMGIYSWELFNDFDVDNVIRIGTAGSFHEDIHIGDIVVGLAASTDSNYIHAFDVPGNYAPCASYELLTKLTAASKETGHSFKAGNIVSCDVFFYAFSSSCLFFSRRFFSSSPSLIPLSFSRRSMILWVVSAALRYSPMMV